VLDRDLLTELQYVLIEPPDGGDTWPSLIWTRDEVLDAVNAALRALFRGVHLRIGGAHLPVAAGARSVPLPTNWLATAIVVWRDTATRTRTPLGPVDSFEADLAVPGWEPAPGLPLGYADLDTEQRTLRLVPTPAADGLLELLYVLAPYPVTGTAPGAELPVADEFVDGIKYAALGTLLRKVGRLIDPERAAYCERRAELTETAAAILLGGFA
jgi:hypothetical protein